MPILSYVLELMGYTTSCVGINLGDPPWGYAPRGVPSVDPSTLGRICPYVTRLPQVLLHFLMSVLPGRDLDEYEEEI